MAVTTIFTAPSGHEQIRNPNRLLAEADRLAFLFNWPRAEPLYAQARALFNQSGDERNALYARLSWIWSRVDAGSASKFEGEVEREMQNPLVRGDPKLMLRCLLAKAAIEQDENEASVQDVWEEILELANRSHDERWQARARAELGTIAFMDGDVEKATKLLRSALVSSFLHGDFGAAIYYGSIVGNGLVEVGQPEAGLKYCDIALKAAAITKDMGFPFVAYEGKARALVALHREPEAKQVLDFAVTQARAQSAHAAEAQLLIVLGKQAEPRDRAQAVAYLRAAVELCQKNGFRHAYAWSTFELARVYRDEGDLSDAEIYESLAIEAMQDVEDKYHLPLHLALLAELEAEKGNAVAADHLYSRAEDVTEGMLMSAPTRQVEASLIGTMSEVYLGHFELAIQLHDVKKAYYVLEMARGRSMADSLRGGHDQLTPRDWMTSAAKNEINRLQIALLHATGRDERTQLLDRLFAAEQLVGPTARPWTRLQRAALRATPAKLGAVQRSLHADETVLEYVLGQSRSYCLYLTQSRVGISTLPANKTQVENLVRRYLEEVKSKQQPFETGRKLYDLLLKPLPRHALKLKLIIIPDGELHLLAFDSLVGENGEYLVASHVVTGAPSATVLYLIRTSTPAAKPKLPFLGVGDVQYEQALPASDKPNGSTTESDSNALFDLSGNPLLNLPQTRDEVVEAAKIFGIKSVQLLRSDATEAAFKAEPLDQFSIIHIAAHGIASAKFPDRSALVLGEDPKNREDGLLQAREIQDLHLSADLITLSACDTGAGRLLGEEGIASLEYAFLYAGARSVLASLWTASDAYTTALIEHFYRHLADGQEEGAALQQAKLELIREFRTNAVPFYWAGFNLAGDASARVVLVAR